VRRQQPPREPFLDRVRAVACGRLRHLRQEGHGVAKEVLAQPGTPGHGLAQGRGVHPPPRARHLHEALRGRLVDAEQERDAHHSLATDHAGLDHPPALQH
jgi:hypothetical protein